MNEFPHLMAPLQLGPYTLPNRVVMGAMHTRLETLDRPDERLARFYAARAEGGAALLLTGGHAPNAEGRIEPGSPVMDPAATPTDHGRVCDAVHAAGGRVALQLLHAGRYAKIPDCVGPSAIRARINRYVPRPLETADVWRTIADFARAAARAQEVGYDGVEVMGSEGYLINEFLAPCTNDRRDEFGGDLDGRLRLPTEIVSAVRAAVGDDFLLIYRISAIDLVEDGLAGDEIVELARRVEHAGADVLNTGIGWHESRVPTIAASVPRAAWAAAIRRVTDSVAVPVIASNRINTPRAAEDLLASGAADLVSMARPLLADPELPRKVREHRTAEINTCVGCNQACLDRIFTERTAGCMVNPRAGHEIEFIACAPIVPRRLGVVGAGPAGLAFAFEAAQRGHRVTLYEAEDAIGGQLDLARRIPGKSEFTELITYFRRQLERAGVDVRLGYRATADHLRAAAFDEVVLATGVIPKVPDIPGVDHPSVVSYIDVLTGRVEPGHRVAIIGAGGIGFDVAHFLIDDPAPSHSTDAFVRAWGIDLGDTTPGGLSASDPPPGPARHSVTMLQRSDTPPGRHLGKSTGWILKQELRRAGVSMVPGVRYDAIGDDGLRYSTGAAARVLPVDTIVLCTGQDSNRDLQRQLAQHNVSTHLIGGAHTVTELDAVAAIDQATRLALSI